MLAGSCSFDHPALKSRWVNVLDWGDAKSDGGTLTLDGGTRPPYNLSAEFTFLLIHLILENVMTLLR